MSAVGHDTIDHSDAQLHPGGIAGLSCALSLLRNHGTEGSVPSPSVALVEWQEQLGGRLHTCKVCHWQVLKWCHSQNHRLFRMVFMGYPISRNYHLDEEWLIHAMMPWMLPLRPTAKHATLFYLGECTVLLQYPMTATGRWVTWKLMQVQPGSMVLMAIHWLKMVGYDPRTGWKLFENDGPVVDFVSCDSWHVAYQSKVCTSTQGFHRCPISISTQLLKVGFMSKLTPLSSCASVSHHKEIKKFGSKFFKVCYSQRTWFTAALTIFGCMAQLPQIAATSNFLRRGEEELMMMMMMMMMMMNAGLMCGILWAWPAV